MSKQKNMSLILLASLLLQCPVFANPKPAAVIVNFEDVEDDDGFTIEHDPALIGEIEEGSSALLYKGDMLTIPQGRDRLEIAFAPFAELTAEGSKYVVQYDPPTGLKAIVWKVCDRLLSFWTNVEYAEVAASRGIANSSLPRQSIPDLLPGSDATLLMNQIVNFKWHEPVSGRFSIRDEKGKVIFSKNLTGANSTEIIPSKIGLIPGGEYTWETGETRYRFRIIPQDDEAMIMSQLNLIDADDMSETARIMKKSEYVQYISDCFPAEIDLYWLSTQWLSGSNMPPDYQKECEMLLRKCVKHMTEKARNRR